MHINSYYQNKLSILNQIYHYQQHIDINEIFLNVDKKGFAKEFKNYIYNQKNGNL